MRSENENFSKQRHPEFGTTYHRPNRGRNYSRVLRFDHAKVLSEDDVTAVVKLPTSVALSRGLAPPLRARWDKAEDCLWFNYPTEDAAYRVLQSFGRTPPQLNDRPVVVIGTNLITPLMDGKKLERRWRCVVCQCVNTRVTFVCPQCEADRIDECDTLEDNFVSFCAASSPEALRFALKPQSIGPYVDKTTTEQSFRERETAKRAGEQDELLRKARERSSRGRGYSNVSSFLARVAVPAATINIQNETAEGNTETVVPKADSTSTEREKINRRQVHCVSDLFIPPTIEARPSAGKSPTEEESGYHPGGETFCSICCVFYDEGKHHSGEQEHNDLLRAMESAMDGISLN